MTTLRQIEWFSVIGWALLSVASGVHFGPLASGLTTAIAIAVTQCVALKRTNAQRHSMPSE